MMHLTPDQVGQRTVTAREPSPNLTDEFLQLCPPDGPLPDVFAFLTGKGKQSLPRLVDVIRLDQSLRWRQGTPQRAEDYFARLPELRADDEAVLQVIFNEFLLRQELGHAPTVEDYQQRFPTHATALQRQIELEQALGRLSTTEGALPPPPEAGGAEPRPPCRLGRYFLVEQLGKGGQAVIYRAIHPVLGRDVVVKLGRRAAHYSAELREHLLVEGRALAELNHPNLARIYDLDLYEGRPLLVLEYVRGRDLLQFCKASLPAPRQAARLVADLAGAVAQVHRRGLLHRDIKPTNVLIDESERPVLIDFGLAACYDAWHTPEEGDAVQGTPAFMAPEQAHGDLERVGPASDVFGLGALLYFLLTGEPPFPAPSPLQSVSRARACDWNAAHPRFLAAPRQLQGICKRALASRACDRFAHAEDLADALDAFVRHRVIAWVSGGIVVTGLCLLAGILLLLRSWLGAASRDEPLLAPSGPSPFAGPALMLGTWREERRAELPIVDGPWAGEDLEAICQIPTGAHALLLVRGSTGKWSRPAAWSPAGQPRYRRCHLTAEQLAGPDRRPGMVLVVLCAGFSGPVRAEEVRQVWQPTSRWPVLPAGSQLRLRAERIVLEHTAGSPSRFHDDSGALQAAWSVLEAFRRRPPASCDRIAGIALPLLPDPASDDRASRQ
jgi:serine/threonine-protein kinase